MMQQNQIIKGSFLLTSKEEILGDTRGRNNGLLEDICEERH